MNRIGQLAALLALMAPTGEAFAEPPRAPAPPPGAKVTGDGLVTSQVGPTRRARDGSVPVVITTTEPGIKVSVRKSDEVVGVCRRECVLQLQPGNYDFRVHEGTNTVGGSRNIDVNGPMQIEFDPDTDEHRWGGVVLSVVGIGSIAALTTIAVTCPSGCGKDESGNDTVGALVYPLVIASLVATPIGLVMWGTAAKPEYEITQLEQGVSQGRRRHVRLTPRRKPAQPRLGVGVAPTPGGGMIGVGMSF